MSGWRVTTPEHGALAGRDLRRLPEDLSLKVVADTVWSMNSPEFYLPLIERRGWSPEEFQGWLADVW
jgi:hypothetical protein